MKEKSARPSELLARIEERLLNMEHKLDLTYNQTTLTNGRVGKLENWRARLNGIWFTVATVLGGGAALAGIIIGVLSLLK